jgi:membrane protease YdiL (CAAX protease family)
VGVRPGVRLAWSALLLGAQVGLSLLLRREPLALHLLPGLLLLGGSLLLCRWAPLRPPFPWGAPRRPLGLWIALPLGLLVLVFDLGWPRLAGPGAGTLAAVALVTIIPLSEELFFRGFLFDALARVLPRWVALLGSALIFGLLHLPQGALVQGLLLGLACGALVIASGGLLPALALHVAWNALSVIVALPQGMSSHVVTASAGAMLALGAAFEARCWFRGSRDRS